MWRIWRIPFLSWSALLCAWGCSHPSPVVAWAQCNLVYPGTTPSIVICEARKAGVLLQIADGGGEPPGCPGEVRVDGLPSTWTVQPGDGGCIVKVAGASPYLLHIVPPPPKVDCQAMDPGSPVEGRDRLACLVGLALECGTGTPTGCEAPLSQSILGPEAEGDRARDALWGAAARELSAGGWSREALKLDLLAAQFELDQRQETSLPEVQPDPADVAMVVLRERVEGQRELLRRSYGTALTHFERALEVASDLGYTDGVDSLVDRIAQTWARLGRHDDVPALYVPLLRKVTSPCKLALLHNNLAWALLLARDLGEVRGIRPSKEDPGVHLDMSERLLAADPAACAGKPSGVNLSVNRAFDLLTRGATDAAAVKVQEARDLAARSSALPLPPPMETLRWLVVIQAEVLQRQGRLDEAEEVWADLGRQAGVAGDLEFLWRAAVGRASVAWEGGEVERARTLFSESERRFQGWAAGVSMEDRLDAFVSWQQRAAARQVRLLLDARDDVGAFDAARRFRALLQARFAGPAATARAEGELGALRSRWAAVLGSRTEGLSVHTRSEFDRALSDLEARAWELTDLAARQAGVPTDAAGRPPEPDEALVLFAPDERPEGMRWLPLVATARAVHVGLSFVPSGAPAEQLLQMAAALAPCAAAISSHPRISFMTPAGLDDVDLALLDLGDGPLFRTHQVAWSLDLPAIPVLPSRPPGPVVLVADPSGDPQLAGATVHVARLGDSLAPRVVEILQVHDRAELVARLSAGPLGALHFAGHARSPAAPLDAGLWLGDGLLTARDVLAAGLAPSLVTLAACEGAETGGGAVGGLGLAIAFGLAGSEVVVGAARKVRAEVAFLFFDTFYALAVAEQSPRAAFQGSLVAVAARYPSEDWGLFRLVLRDGAGPARALQPEVIGDGG